MENCPICFDTKPLISLHGVCSFCAECISGWLQTLVLNKSIHSDSHIICPTQGCTFTLAVKSITENLPREYIEQLNNAYLKNYLIDKPDVFHCPNQKCKYAGFSIPSHFGCKVPFHCERCNSEWTNPLIRGSSDSFCQKFKTFLTKEFSSKKCPNCGTYITLFAGCPMVTCTACRTQFSWYRVFHRGWVVLYFLLGIPLFVLLAYFYEDFANYAASHWYTRIAMWILQIILAYIWFKFLLHYLAITNHCISQMSRCQIFVRIPWLLIPIGSLILLNFVLPGYYKYWLVIGGVVFGLLATLIISIVIGEFRRNRRDPQRRHLLDQR